MKKGLSILLVVLLVVSIYPMGLFSVTANAAEINGYKYFIENRNATIACETSISGEVTIPSTLNGYEVTSLGDYAFYYCSSLTSVTIPSGITNISKTSFRGCSSLINITVDSNNDNYSSENGVLFTKNKKYLTAYPAGKTETSYIIPNGVKCISEFAFSDCKNLTSVTIPKSVTNINDYAFYHCSSLTDVWYGGSESEKDAIFTFNENPALEVATWHYNTCTSNHAYSNNCDRECNVCGYVRNNITHTYDNDCDINCNICGFKRNVSAHSFEITKIEPTCETKGQQTKKCSKCLYEETTEIVAKGHSYSNEWTVDIKATCTTTGMKSHHCFNCDSKTDLTNIAPTGHDFSTWEITKEPSTQTVGEAQRKCKNIGCKETEAKTIAKLAEDGHTHKFGNWETKEKSTCTKNGQNIRKCSICSETELTVVLSEGHNFNSWQLEKQQTCTEDGVIIRVCKVCNEKEIDTISHTGHQFTEFIITKEATETEAGIKTKTCSVCGEKVEEEITMLGSTSAPSDNTIGVSGQSNEKPKDKDNATLFVMIAIGAVVLIGGAITTIILIKKKKSNIVE